MSAVNESQILPQLYWNRNLARDRLTHAALSLFNTNFLLYRSSCIAGTATALEVEDTNLDSERDEGTWIMTSRSGTDKCSRPIAICSDWEEWKVSVAINICSSRFSQILYICQTVLTVGMLHCWHPVCTPIDVLVPVSRCCLSSKWCCLYSLQCLSLQQIFS